MAIDQNDGFRSNVNIYVNEQKIKKGRKNKKIKLTYVKNFSRMTQKIQNDQH